MKLKEFIADIFLWKKSEWKFKKFIKRCELRTAEVGGKRIAVLVTPWLMTKVPWFSITLGLMLHQRSRRVTYIFDDYKFGNSPFYYRLQVSSIRRVFSLLKGNFQVELLSDYARLSDMIRCDNTHETIERLAEMCTTHRLRGESPGEDRLENINITKQRLVDMLPAVAGLLQQHNFSYYVVPGGVLSSTGLMYELNKNKCTKSNARIVSYDSGPGAVVVSINGIAAQRHDTRNAMQKIKQEPENLGFIHEASKKDITQRQHGNDRLVFQKIPLGASDLSQVLPGGCLIPLNSSWDSAALGLHHVFSSSIDWIVQTVKWFIQNTSEKVYIRQHPVERFVHAKSNDDIGRILINTFGNHPQVRFISAEEGLNTYDLLKKVSVVVAHTSTVGIEAAALGIPVITQSNNYYSELGFVYKVETKQQYFELIKIALAGGLSCDKQRQDAALECYYVSQMCSRIYTDFDPETRFNKWVSMGLDDLRNDSNVSMLLDAIDKNIPISLLVHRKRMASL